MTHSTWALSLSFSVCSRPPTPAPVATGVVLVLSIALSSGMGARAEFANMWTSAFLQAGRRRSTIAHSATRNRDPTATGTTIKMMPVPPPP